MNPKLRKYLLAEVPRYTSYPTAVEFHNGVGEADYREWLAALGTDESLSVYVHVPFCQKLCWYCGCHTTIAHDYDRIAAYLATLRAELALLGGALPAQHGRVKHVHFGGGTPTIMSGADLIAFMADLRARIPLAADADIAIEIDPRTLCAEKAAALAEAGVTRASLGVQEFASHIQARINRIQPYYVVDTAVQDLRDAGITRINFDLMYGLPGQSVADIERSVALTASLAPDRVAVFGYAHVPWFKKHQEVISDADLPGPVERFEQAEAASAALKAHGYVEIGFDHYAKPEDGLAQALKAGTLRRNFQGYTDDPADVLLPLGASSIGSLSQGYVQNAPRLDVYRDLVDAGRLPIMRGRALDADDRLHGEAIMRLMCDMRLDVAALCVRHGLEESALDDALVAMAPLSDDGLVRVTGRRVEIPESARRFVRTVASCFDAYERGNEKRHSRAV